MKEIILTYCPSNVEKDRICGHTFEVMDYFLMLWDAGIQSKILIQEDISKEKIFQAWEDKYNLPDGYQEFIKFKKYPKVIISKDILIFTSGFHIGYVEQTRLIYKKLLLMRCNPFYDYTNLLKKKNIHLLQDDRVYQKFGETKDINYIKKIYFKRYKTLQKYSAKTLVYLNTNLRKIDNLVNIEQQKDTLYVSGDKMDVPGILVAPVPNLFQKFSKFLYTKTSRQFDCSPRLITECIFYDKEIIWDFDFNEYAQENTGDTGLYWRWFDIQNNFWSLELTQEDDILKYL